MTILSQQKSEVAAALAAIKREYEAAQRGLYGMAAVARHAAIAAQQQRVSDRFRELAAIVGDEGKAMALFAATLEHVEVGGGTQALL